MPGTKSKTPQKLRIGRGSLGGQVLSFETAPGLRPTLSRIREAVFSMLMPYASSHGFLDLCSGTGIMALEAASIGFSPIVCVEPHQPSMHQIRQHFKRLGQEAVFIQSEAQSLVRRKLRTLPWCIYADPPFQLPSFHSQLLTQLEQATFPAPGSIYIAESESDPPQLAPTGWRTLKQKKYGRVTIWVGEKE